MAVLGPAPTQQFQANVARTTSRSPSTLAWVPKPGCWAEDESLGSLEMHHALQNTGPVMLD